MKKIILCFLLLSLVLSVASCNKPTENTPKEYTVLEVGGADGGAEANHKAEIFLRMEDYWDEGAVSQKEVQIQGKSFQGEYKESRKHYYFQSNVDQYLKYEKGECRIEFWINKDTGRMDLCSWDFFDDMDGKEAPTLDEEQYLSIAMEYLNNFVDVSEYTVEADYYSNSSNIFNFVRVIDGVQTSDKATISVNTYGEVIYHLFTSLGEMKDATAPSAEVFEQIDSSVEKKIQSFYDNATHVYDYSYKIKDKTFAKMADGRYAIVYGVSVRVFPSETEPDVSYPEAKRFLVYLD